MEKTVLTIERICELSLICRLLYNWAQEAKRTDHDYGFGHALHDRVRSALIEKMKEESSSLIEKMKE